MRFVICILLLVAIVFAGSGCQSAEIRPSMQPEEIDKIVLREFPRGASMTQVFVQCQRMGLTPTIYLRDDLSVKDSAPFKPEDGALIWAEMPTESAMLLVARVGSIEFYFDKRGYLQRHSTRVGAVGF